MKFDLIINQKNEKIFTDSYICIVRFIIANKHHFRVF